MPTQDPSIFDIIGTGKLSDVKAFIKKNNIDINNCYHPKEGFTLIEWAAFLWHDDIVLYLLGRGAKINQANRPLLFLWIILGLLEESQDDDHPHIPNWAYDARIHDPLAKPAIRDCLRMLSVNPLAKDKTPALSAKKAWFIRSDNSFEIGFCDRDSNEYQQIESDHH